ncbi:MAG: hypothetical protein ACREL7_03650 [Longimicrobiales bacterium]
MRHALAGFDGALRRLRDEANDPQAGLDVRIPMVRGHSRRKNSRTCGQNEQ